MAVSALCVVVSASCFLRLPLFGFMFRPSDLDCAHFVFLFCVSTVLLLSSSRRRPTASSIIATLPHAFISSPSPDPYSQLCHHHHCLCFPISTCILIPRHRVCCLHHIISPISHISYPIPSLFHRLPGSPISHLACASSIHIRIVFLPDIPARTHTYMRTHTHPRTRTRTCTLARARTPDVGTHRGGFLPLATPCSYVLFHFLISPRPASSPCSHSYGRNYLGSVSVPVPVPLSARSRSVYIV